MMKNHLQKEKKQLDTDDNDKNQSNENNKATQQGDILLSHCDIKMKKKHLPRETKYNDDHPPTSTTKAMTIATIIIKQQQCKRR